MSRLDLAGLLVNICISDCKVLDNGVLLIDHQTLVQVFAFFLCFMKQVVYYLHIFLCQPIRLWVMGRACYVIHIVFHHQVGKFL